MHDKHDIQTKPNIQNMNRCLKCQSIDYLMTRLNSVDFQCISLEVQ